MTSNTRLSCGAALIGALSLAGGCDLGGGDVQARPDAGTGIGAPDAADGNGNGSELSACQQVMQGAPAGEGAPSFRDALPTATQNTWDGESVPSAGDEDYPGGKYRTIEPDGDGAIHPGCDTDDLAYAPADIPGYPCAAVEYDFPEGVDEELDKPIVILVHGNSDLPASWEAFVHPDPQDWMDGEARDQLAELLPAAGYRTIAVDMRALDRNDDPPANETRNIDHGWGVPLTEALIRAVVENDPGRDIAVVGFSLGATVARDALRRLWIEWHDDDWDVNIFERVSHVVAASGGHHGVSTYQAYCEGDTTMQRHAACELGLRGAYTPVPFHEPLNGPRIEGASEWGGWYESPCADGDYAFGRREACGGRQVHYTTIAMEDNADGTQQDAIVSEHASRLYPDECVNNVVNPQSAFDTSGYFANGLLRNHYGSIRSEAGIQVILDALAQ